MNEAMNRFANLLPATLLLAAVACGDDAEVDEAGEEIITTLELTFTPTGGGAPLVATFRDLDDEGGDDPVIDDIVLVDGTTYELEIVALNETVDPADPEYRIIDEITEEAEEHQFFFHGPAVESDTTGANPNALVVVSYEDLESDYTDEATDPDLPVGVRNTVVASAPGSVNDGFIVTLKHQPPNNGVPVKTETSGLNDGGTDANVAFDITVQ
jgi:hypothetical protein